jgi:hypothetical protein
VCLIAPLICYVIDLNSVSFLGGYHFGNELLILNGLLTFSGLALISRRVQVMPELV